MEFFSAKKPDKKIKTQKQMNQEERFLPTSEFYTPDLSRMTLAGAGLSDQELLDRLVQDDGLPTWRDVDDSLAYKRQQLFSAREECVEKFFNHNKTDRSPKSVAENVIQLPNSG